MFGKLFLTIYALPLPFVLIMLPLTVILWTGVVLSLREKAPLDRIVNAVFFVISLLALFYVTTYRGPVKYAALILRPFHCFKEAKIQPEIYRSMLMNVLLFFPFGLFLPFVFPERVKHPVRLTLILALLCSVTVETVQYVFSLGRAETDDVIINMIGTAFGTLSYLLAVFLKRVEPKLPAH